MHNPSCRHDRRVVGESPSNCCESIRRESRVGINRYNDIRVDFRDAGIERLGLAGARLPKNPQKRIE
jgi:hypothetical protein